jgi:hypothetical protein
MKKITNPPTAYPSMRPGPAFWTALAEPKNTPTPMAPPMAMSSICRRLQTARQFRLIGSLYLTQT